MDICLETFNIFLRTHLSIQQSLRCEHTITYPSIHRFINTPNNHSIYPIFSPPSIKAITNSTINQQINPTSTNHTHRPIRQPNHSTSPPSFHPIYQLTPPSVRATPFHCPIHPPCIKSPIHLRSRPPTHSYSPHLPAGPHLPPPCWPSKNFKKFA